MSSRQKIEHSPRLRSVPLDFDSMVAICSDLDETPNAEVYFQMARYLNTERETSIGRGVGLEVGNTMYFDMPADQFSYWNCADVDREKIHALIRSGHIDCLHSFGDFANTRAHAKRALEALRAAGCRLEVWIDHAIAPSNFGADIMRGSGDVPNSDVYHADLTCAFGVQYVWRGRVTSVIGQNRPGTLKNIADWRNPLSSGITLARETAKGILARTGSRKYCLHAENKVLQTAQLRDGQPIHEFLRSNPHWRGVNKGENPDGIGEVLSEKTLHFMARRKAIGIIYTHLGKIKDHKNFFLAPARAGFERLAQFQADGKILVTTTRRLLGYCRAQSEVKVDCQTANNVTHIGVHAQVSSSGPALRPEDLQGLTFYVDDPERCELNVNGAPRAFIKNPADHTGKRSISLPWRKLEFPGV